MLRNDSWNVFLKYGLNGRSHAHPDIMNIEVMYKNLRLSRDLSNAGYQSRLCNEWHRKTLAHNTVCWNGTDITSVEPGKCLLFENDRVRCKAENVYEGIDYTRELKITENSVLDYFQAEGKTGVYDYTFTLSRGLSCPATCRRKRRTWASRRTAISTFWKPRKLKQIRTLWFCGLSWGQSRCRFGSISRKDRNCSC